jgi:hypothetical protein
MPAHATLEAFKARLRGTLRHTDEPARREPRMHDRFSAWVPATGADKEATGRHALPGRLALTGCALSRQGLGRLGGTATPAAARLQEGASMQIRRCATYAVAGVLVLLCLAASPVLAQSAHAHAAASHARADQQTQASALVQVVRDATARFHDVAVAEQEGYSLQFGCVSGPDFGAMGLHFVNMPLVMDGELDATRPEIILYEPQPDGSLQLTGADYLVLADAWNATHAGPPELMGQLLHLFETPNRFGLPAFYTLHVWAWKDSPTGTFVNWHANVSCDAFSGQHP